MKNNVTLIVASLLSILFFTLHLAGDVVRGMESGRLSTLISLPIMVVWLYATLVLVGRRSGYVVVLLMSLLGMVVPIVHMKGVGVGGAIANSSGGFFFVWILLAMGVTSLFSVVLSARGLWEDVRRENAG